MMGFPFGWKASASCPNCGAKGWEDKKDHECEKCGFRKVETKELPPIQLTFCDECGCTLSEPCKRHDASKQRPVKL